jgi:segregation and condensation protein B
MEELKKKVEAILFSSGRVVSVKELKTLLHLKEPGLVNETIRELREEYAERDSPVMILDEDDGWKLTVKEQYLPVVQKVNPHTELSKSILETLAVITWKQPIIQSDVIKIRTNKAYDHISELLRLGFITKDRHGRSFIIKVTQKFLDYFDLPDNSAIKEVFKDFKDVEVAMKKKADKLEKAVPEENKEETGKTPAEEGTEAESQETSSEEDVSDELEPYIDVLPEAEKPKKGPELEVYEATYEQAEEAVEEEKAEEAEQAEAEAEQEEAETPEEKARRIAREVLGEHPPEEKKEPEHEERQLHPQLEEFIATAEEIKVKPTEEHEAEEGDEHEEPEESEEEHAPEEGEDEEPEEHETEEGEESEEPGEKHLPAEEYPGQFEESEEPEEKQEN